MATEPQFKTGDRVRLTGRRWNNLQGSIKIVEGVDRDGDAYFYTGGGLRIYITDNGYDAEPVTEDTTSELETLIQDIGLTNEANGFNRTPEEARDPDYLSNKLLLIVSEIIEAQDEIRNDHEVDFTYYTKDGKPEGFVSEIADVFIRVLGTVHELGITEQFLKMVPEKLEYNKGRGFRHGKKF